MHRAVMTMLLNKTGWLGGLRDCIGPRLKSWSLQVSGQPLCQATFVHDGPRMGVARSITSVTRTTGRNQFSIVITEKPEYVYQGCGIEHVRTVNVLIPVRHSPFEVRLDINPDRSVLQEARITTVRNEC